MEAVSLVVAAAPAMFALLQGILDVADAGARHYLRAFRLLELYGPPGLTLFWFGSKITWRTEAQVLGQMIDQDALAFKQYVQDECTMVSVAAAIVAQISITALSLSALSQTHWITRGLLVLSLTNALMAVFYATTQQRIMGRLLKASQVRMWIRGGTGSLDRARIVPSFEQLQDSFITKLEQKLEARAELERTDEERQDSSRINGATSSIPLSQIFLHSHSFRAICLGLLRSRNRYCPHDPKDFNAQLSSITTLKTDLKEQCFTPSVASVITLSAPQMLLSASLGSLLVALGVYLGFTWTRDLDNLADDHDSRNVFIMYVIGLGVSVFVYTISSVIQDEDKRTEAVIIDDYVDDWIGKNLDVVHGWGFEASYVGDGRLYFTALAANSVRWSEAEELGGQVMETNSRE